MSEKKRSNFVGVYWSSRTWRPMLMLGKSLGFKWLGSYDDETTAAWVREAAIVKFDRNLATRNFPGQDVPAWATTKLDEAMLKEQGKRGPDLKKRRVPTRVKGRRYYPKSR